MNITELADNLGLSVSTISKALNGYSGVSQKTRDRVQKAAVEYGYHPQASARSLRRKNTDRIGLLDPVMGSGEWEQQVLGEHFLRKLKGVVTEAEREHKDLVIYTTQPLGNPSEIRKIANSRDVDGLIVFGSAITGEEIRMIRDSGIPFVLHGKLTGVKEVSYVVPDMEHAGYLATRHLLQQGYRTIAYVGQERDVDSNHLRYGGYCRALEEAGLAADRSLCVSADFSPDGGRMAFRQLLSQNRDVDAAFFYSDGLYFEALPEIRDLAKGNTTSFGSVGIDDIYRARWSEPGLSSIHLPLEEMGERAVSLLLRLIEDPKSGPIEEILPVELVVRGSSTRSAG